MRVFSINCDSSTQQVLQELSGSAHYQLTNFPAPADPSTKWDPREFDLMVLGTGQLPSQWIPVLRNSKERNPRLAVILLCDPSELELTDSLDFRSDYFLPQKIFSRQLSLVVNQVNHRLALDHKTDKALGEAERYREELRESLDQQKEVRVEKDLTYRELLLAYSRLQDVNQKKNNFLARATHELRTPVTVIKGYHRILLDERLGKLQPEQRKVLLESEESCSRLIKIINSLLDLSRIEAGKLELAYQENDFVDSIKRVVAELKDVCRRKSLSLDMEVDDRIPRFQYDREKVNQVLTNLLDNSIKYTPQGGRILLSVRPYFWERHDFGNVAMPDRQRNGPANGSPEHEASFNSVRVEISDTGIGISPEHQQEIFEEFTQASSNHANHSGLGLGLTISKRIIDAHGGRIMMESQVNVGSKFVFLLPFVPTEATGRNHDVPDV